VEFRVLARPAIQDCRQRWWLSAARGKVLLQYEEQNQVPFGCEVGDVLGDNGPSLGARSRCDLSIFGASEARIARVDRVMPVFLSQQHGRGRREDLVDHSGEPVGAVHGRERVRPPVPERPPDWLHAIAARPAAKS
jgi:hypothetical protein